MGNEALDIYKERARILREIWGSFLYFVCEWCWIEDKVTSTPTLFKLWPSQRGILPQFLKAFRLIILKARQLGLTWLCAAYALWLCITRPLQLVVVISAKEDWAIEFLDRCKFILDRLPEWMVPPVNKRTGQILEFQHEGNLLSTIKSLATTPEGAQSKTPTLLILDETARNRYIKEIWAASKPGIDAGGGRIIVISNSIKDGVGWGWTRGIYQKSMAKINDFERIFMSWTAHPGRKESFLEQQKAEGMDDEDISQHYPSTEDEAISTLLGSYFGKVLSRHQDSLCEGVRGNIRLMPNRDLEFEASRGGILEVWRFPYMLVDSWDQLNWTHRYVIGSDISEGLGQSYSVAYVYDRHLQEIVARMRSNRIDAYTWANRLYDLSRWYDNAMIVAERTGAGITTVKRLQELKANQYMRTIAGKAGIPVTKEIGWQETEQNKQELCGDLKNWFREVRIPAVYCSILIDECSTWIRDENGRLGPEEGALGDCVIAAGCMVQGDIFITTKPATIKPPVTGWLKRIREEGRSNWAR